MESAVGLEVDLCKECIEWARQEKRNYLRQGNYTSHLNPSSFRVQHSFKNDILNNFLLLLHEIKVVGFAANNFFRYNLR